MTLPPEGAGGRTAERERQTQQPSAADRHVGMDYNVAARKMGRKLLFQQLKRLNPDTILGVMAKFRADTSPLKVDLGVGVYRDLSGNTPVLACVRSAEQAVLAAQTTKSYVAAAGREEFNRAVEEMVLGNAHAARRDRRVRTVQTPGGAGHCAWVPS